MKLISLSWGALPLSILAVPTFPLLDLFLSIILYLHPLSIYPVTLKVLDSKLRCQLVTTDASPLGFNNCIVYFQFINGY